MGKENLLSINFPDSDVREINQAIALLKKKLLPHLKTLSSQDRNELPKMGDRTLDFVQKSLEYSLKNSELVPGFMDVEEFKKDFDSIMLLREYYQPLLQIVEALSDSQVLLGSEVYQTALMFYNSVKIAARSNITNANTIYEDLSTRFPTRSRKVSSFSV